MGPGRARLVNWLGTKLELQKSECNKASDTEAGCFVPNITSGGKENKMAQINIHVTQLVPFLKRFLLLLLLLLSSVLYLIFIISPPCLFYFWIGHNLPLSLSLFSLWPHLDVCYFLFLSTLRLRKLYPLAYTLMKNPRKVTIGRIQTYV